MSKIRGAKFQIGQVVRHRLYPVPRRRVRYRSGYSTILTNGIQSIPAEVRRTKDQPFYHLFAENDQTEYVAYVSEQICPLPDTSGEPLRHHANFRSVCQETVAARLPATRGTSALKLPPFSTKLRHDARVKFFQLNARNRTPGLGNVVITRVAQRPGISFEASLLASLRCRWRRRRCTRSTLLAFQLLAGLRRRGAAILPAVSFAALQTPSDRSAGRHRPLGRSRQAAAPG